LNCSSTRDAERDRRVSGKPPPAIAPGPGEGAGKRGCELAQVFLAILSGVLPTAHPLYASPVWVIRLSVLLGGI
jgi:hypothetical protein